MTKPVQYISLICFAVGLCLCGCRHQMPLSEQDYLQKAWESYKSVYLHKDGYVFDPSNNGGEVTSEGQSYALLRAVWLDDKRTFKRVYNWTEENLKRTDGMYAWRWHPETGITDQNTATDADQDIALALILAAHHFNKPAYLKRAREIVVAVRQHTAIAMGTSWFPSAGNWAVDERIVNLSYFMPYSYPYFDRIDPDGNWLGVIETGYDLIKKVRDVPDVVLIPDFMIVGEAGDIELITGNEVLSGDFSFDSMRIFWRVALDCKLNARPAACTDPAGVDKMMELLKNNGKIVLEYTLDAIPLSHTQSLSFYGSLLPAFERHAPEMARRLKDRELSLRVLSRLLEKDNRYYDRNWVWFGYALSSGLIEERMLSPSVIPLSVD